MLTLNTKIACIADCQGYLFQSCYTDDSLVRDGATFRSTANKLSSDVNVLSNQNSHTIVCLGSNESFKTDVNSLLTVANFINYTTDDKVFIIKGSYGWQHSKIKSETLKARELMYDAFASMIKKDIYILDLGLSTHHQTIFNENVRRIDNFIYKLLKL